MKWGWIDLLASIPAVDALRWGRAFRLVRLLRVLRAIRATHRLMEFVLARRAEAAVLGAALLSLMMAVISSILMLTWTAFVASWLLATARQKVPDPDARAAD